MSVKYSLQYGMTGQCWQGKTSCTLTTVQHNSLNFNILPPPVHFKHTTADFCSFLRSAYAFRIFCVFSAPTLCRTRHFSTVLS